MDGGGSRREGGKIIDEYIDAGHVKKEEVDEWREGLKVGRGVRGLKS